MGPCGEEFCDACRVEASFRESDSSPQSSATGSNNHRIVSVVDYRVCSRAASLQMKTFLTCKVVILEGRGGLACFFALVSSGSQCQQREICKDLKWSGNKNNCRTSLVDHTYAAGSPS
jgi:hypothetical protein